MPHFRFPVSGRAQSTLIMMSQFSKKANRQFIWLVRFMPENYS
jgi:hypothetical protein